MTEEMNQTANLVSRMVTGEVQRQPQNIKKALSVRMSLDIFSSLDALSDMSDVSLNDMANLMLEAGLEAILCELPDDKREDFTKVQEALLLELIKKETQ